MHRYRFLAEKIGPSDWIIRSDEAKHAIKVLRLEPGAELEVTDGKGLWALGHLVNKDISSLLVQINKEFQENAPPWRISFAIGALKPGSVDDIIPSIVELGADIIMIYQQEGNAKTRIAAHAIDRWHRIILNSIKQCKRSLIPDLVIYKSLSELIAQTSSIYHRIFFTPETESSLLSIAPNWKDDVLLLVGGERGLDQSEHASLLNAGFHPTHLGSNILRATTASIAAVALAALHRTNNS